MLQIGRWRAATKTERYKKKFFSTKIGTVVEGQRLNSISKETFLKKKKNCNWSLFFLLTVNIFVVSDKLHKTADPCVIFSRPTRSLPEPVVSDGLLDQTVRLSVTSHLDEWTMACVQNIHFTFFLYYTDFAPKLNFRGNFCFLFHSPSFPFTLSALAPTESF